jgi:DNA primase
MFKDRLFQHFRPIFNGGPRSQGQFQSQLHGSGGFRRNSGQFGRKGAPKPRFEVPPHSTPLATPDSGARIREKILLATLINHPELFDHVEERLGVMTFSEARLDLLRQTAVMHIAQNPELDFAVLSAQLSAIGYAQEIATLLHPEVYQHAAFARPSAELDRATAGWDKTFALCQRAALEADLERAERELVENPSNEALAIRDALLHQVQRFLAEDD